MLGSARIFQKICALLNLIGTILAMNNTRTLYLHREDSYTSPPARIINHSQIDFSKKWKGDEQRLISFFTL